MHDPEDLSASCRARPRRSRAGSGAAAPRAARGSRARGACARRRARRRAELLALERLRQVVEGALLHRVDGACRSCRARSSAPRRRPAARAGSPRAA